MTEGFRGFPKTALRFYRQLEENNERIWFQEHKDEYTRNVVEPAQDFVLAMAGPLRKISPTLNTDPRAYGGGSILRIYRDTRFSKDKTPYKTWLGIRFWDGDTKENPGFFFYLTSKKLGLFGGYHSPTPGQLEKIRAGIADPKTGSALVRTIRKLEKAGYEIRGKHYKRMPRGYEVDGARADYLLYRGIFSAFEQKIPPELHEPVFVDYCAGHYKAMAPLFAWMQRVVA